MNKTVPYPLSQDAAADTSAAKESHRFVAEQKLSFFSFLKKLSLVLGGVVLFIGLGASVFLSQHQQNTEQHAAANYNPPDGMGVYDSCGPTCFDHLDTLSLAGFKVVLDYSMWGKSTTIAQVLAYADRAQQDGLKVIWSLKDMWTDKWSTIDSYPSLTAACGCHDKISLAKFLVNQVKNKPATWGYYIADEPKSTDYNKVATLSNAVHSIDSNHPRIIIKSDTLFNGYAPNAAALGKYAPLAEVLGEDYYPVSYHQSIAAVGDIANEVQYIANSNGRESTMVLEVNSGNSSDYIHATAYPSETQMQELLTLTLQHSHPRLVLWYWYPYLSSEQWNNLVNAVNAVSDPAPIGYIDGASCGASGVSGWTCDASGYSQHLRVDFYADGPAGSGKAIGSTQAQVVREAAVGQLCGGSTAHGFTYTLPSTITDGKQHTIYAYGINYPTQQGGTLLTNSPKAVQCPSPSVPASSPSPTANPSYSPTPSKSPTPSMFPRRKIGDINGDGVVNIIDYQLMMACYGGKLHDPTCTAGLAADLDGNGVVDGIDYNILLRAMAN